MINPLDLIFKFIKSSNQKDLDRIGKIVDKTNLLEESAKGEDGSRSKLYRCYRATVVSKISHPNISNVSLCGLGSQNWTFARC